MKLLWLEPQGLQLGLIAMAQEQLSGWIDTIIAAASGVVTAVVGIGAFGWRLGRRDQEIDQQIAEAAEEAKDRLHELRLYVDEQDRKDRHDLANIMQQEASKTDVLVDKVIAKVEYHEQHDDRRFSELTERITDGFKDLAERIADLRVQVAIRQARDFRDESADPRS